MEKTEKRTAEEILDNLIEDRPFNVGVRETSIKAMHEYAAQELAEYKARLKEAISEDYKVTMLRSQGLRTVINVDSVYQLIDKL